MSLYLRRLVLSDFRNYRRLVWEPEASCVVLTGGNGSGKTNLLEAVSLLVPGRGLRAARADDLPRRDAGVSASSWGVVASVDFGPQGGLADLSTGVAPGADRSREFRIDGQAARPRSAVADLLSAVWLTPQMDRLFTESPGGRRRFLDRLVVALVPHHARAMAAAERAMRQRNRLLQMRSGEGAWLSGLEEEFARHTIAIVAARMELIARLNTGAAGMTGGFPPAHLVLSCAVAEQLARMPALAAEDWLQARLARSRAEDAVRGQTGTGAHRADIAFQDMETGRDGALSSTGQQKALLIGIVLAHAGLIGRERGHPPVLLLDEPLVHLDRGRREMLLQALAGLPTTVLMTGTDRAPFDALEGRASFVTLADGSVKKPDGP
ncbi:DNA replication/repair protein RecF [Acetobacter sp. AN02]|uniref:DNA replication/repair protein RecF n=1 Tax=Acetobacter sp. AN02 TaxID=2894186 RepID=UPI0024346242|nr:DNA replication/repair protein RecF [Acetobacter sp. AN02]MDG6095056.1 DNA replication/repair protein RecF [Acetobacter sp. AN02]